MQWYKFVFSKKPAYRLFRHSVFWVAWWIYFSLCQYLFQKPFSGNVSPFIKIGSTVDSYIKVGSLLLLKTFLLVLMDAAACYLFIYFLLPQFIKGKWLKPFVNTLLLGIFMFGAAWFMYWSVFPFVDSLFGDYKANHYFTRFWPAVGLGLIDPLKVVAAAAIITYVKYWWVKQKESERLEREKITAELQLLKAQIQPAFLFTALKNIYEFSLAASPRAPEMLLKLSDLLSYMLYECDEPLVPLDKEAEMMKGYMALEKIRLNDTIEMELNVKGDMSDKLIAPFLLLPFIENSFKQSSTLTEQAWMNMDISIEGDTFTMKLANGVLPDSNALQAFSEDGLDNVKKRLSLMYPQRHELKINQHREMLTVLLKIQLAETTHPLSHENEEALTIEPTTPKSKRYAFQ
jgi:Histidine kinase